jgi:hypothetical protein
MARGQSQSSSKSAQRLPYIFGRDGRAIILESQSITSRRELGSLEAINQRDIEEKLQKQSTYWKQIDANIVDKSDGFDSITAGARAKEVAEMDIVEKKKYIVADIQKAQKEGMFDNLFENGDTKYSGVDGMKIGGTTSRFAGGSSLEITAKIPIDSPFGRAYDQFSKSMSRVKGDTFDTFQDFKKSPYGKAQNEVVQRLSQSVEQFNYTRMNSQDDSYGTNFYFSTSVSIVDKAGKEVYRLGRI